jgi:hypothetical protein
LEITGWSLDIGAGVLPSPFSTSATLNSHNRFNLPAGALGISTLKLDAATGLLSGSFHRVTAAGTARPARFKGVLLLEQKLGRGVFTLPEGSNGAMELTPAPAAQAQ